MSINIKGLLRIPNLLTLFRIPAGPVMAWFLLEVSKDANYQNGAAGSRNWWIAILILSIMVFLSDLFDGILARNMKQVSDFGKIMDPVADSTFFMSLLFALSASPRFDMPIWIPLLVMYREIAIHVVRRYVALTGVIMAAGISGKIKMAVQCIVLSLLGLFGMFLDFGYIKLDNGEYLLRTVSFYGGILIVFVNIVSLLIYLRGLPGFFATDSSSESS